MPRRYSIRLIASLILIVFLLEGAEKSAADDDYLEKCCDQGSRWAGQKLRCEKFSGDVLGVTAADQPACLEAVDICCRKAFQDAECELGKKDARSGDSCRGADDNGNNLPSSSTLGVGDFRRNCCEGCKLGLLNGSGGKSCSKKFSLGAAWDPAFAECCIEARSSSTSTSTLPSTKSSSTSTTTTSDSNEFDFDDEDVDGTDLAFNTTSNSDDLCKLLKGLLCSEICIPTPGSYYCKCREGSILQPDGRSCKSNTTTTAVTQTSPTTTKLTTTTVAPTTTSKKPSTTKFVSKTKKPTTSPTKKKQTSTTTKPKTTTTTTIATTTKDDKKLITTKSLASTLKDKLLGSKARTTRSASTEDNELNTACPSGYRFVVTNESCVDIDECADDKSACPSNTYCININGSYNCLLLENGIIGCDIGYKWNSTIERCDDVDECEENIHKCLVESEICRNLEGSYECEIKCERGYIFDPIYGACLDINECTELTNICPHPDTICINTLGSYECRNLNEYNEQFAGLPSDNNRPGDYETVDEADIDECLLEPNPCAPGELCRNTLAGYDCIPPPCPRGFELIPGDICQDVDECAMGLHACSETERCQNTNGSFTCEPPRPTPRPSTTELPRILCRKGFKLDNATDNCIDIDECIEGPGCRDHERCRNTIGSYDCSPLCGPGWYFQLLTKTCQDVDECLLGHHNCRQRTQYCRNTNGSYVCEHLPACGSGYRRSNHDGSCVDVDECLEGLHNCAREHHRYCVNRDGGYECITRLPSCPRGFEYSLLTQDCVDVDECRIGKAGCDVRIGERCLNLPGGYRCERVVPESRPTKRRPACPAGYSYDPALRKCSDIDECEEGSHDCGEKKCYNLPGGFQCAKAALPVIRRKPNATGSITTALTTSSSKPSTIEICPPGYRYDTTKGRCLDIDECKEQDETCASINEECHNIPGGFTCPCRPGFRRDDFTNACVDVNECQLKNDCLPSQRCDNTIGSYICVRFLPCGTGYTLNAATEICEDDDECILSTHDCGPGYHCRNTLGSYRCDRNRGKPSVVRTTVRTTPRTTTVAKKTTTTTTTKKTTTTTVAPKTTTAKFKNVTAKPKNLNVEKTSTSTSKPSTTTIVSKSTTTSKPKVTSKPNTQITTTATTTTTGRANFAITSTTEEVPTVRTLTTATVKPRVTSVAVKPPVNCPRGWEAGSIGQCIDIDECYRNVKLCGNQRCINTLGSFRCEPKILCSIGYAPDNGQCKDIDECALGTHKCGPKQTCENRQGGYVCYCPSGYEVGSGHECIDIDECSRVAGLCGSGGRCVNTQGSYNCVCKPGFENEPGNGCKDIDECKAKPGPCHQDCYNTWGSFRCGCNFGYRLRHDNRTCEDVDECTEFKENNLCIGICDNTPGSYACRCPDGYNLADDGRTCMDIDECATGNVCKTSGDLCQNLRGSFRCNRIVCPSGYIRDPQKTNRCIRENPYCQMHDQACLQRPAHYTYNYIGIVALYPIPPNTGQVELFTMRGAYKLPGSSVRFNLALIAARAPPRVRPATEDCFALRQPFPAQAVLVMTKSLEGPQDVELELSMEIYGPNNVLAGSAVARIFIIVTQYEF